MTEPAPDARINAGLFLAESPVGRIAAMRQFLPAGQSMDVYSFCSVVKYDLLSYSLTVISYQKRMDTIQITVNRKLAQRVVEELTANRDRLRKELDEAELELAQINFQMEGAGPFNQFGNVDSNLKPETTPRAKRGSLETMVETYLASQPAGATHREITDAVQRPASSIHAVLKSKADKFIRDDASGKWKLK